jgi:hypothetical protein
MAKIEVGDNPHMELDEKYQRIYKRVQVKNKNSFENVNGRNCGSAFGQELATGQI